MSLIEVKPEMSSYEVTVALRRLAHHLEQMDSGSGDAKIMRRAAKLIDQPEARILLDWLTHNHYPLHLMQEADEDGGCWVVAHNIRRTVHGSGETALDALRDAYRNFLGSGETSGVA